jgi:hypothetical protein
VAVPLELDVLHDDAMCSAARPVRHRDLLPVDERMSHLLQRHRALLGVEADEIQQIDDALRALAGFVGAWLAKTTVQGWWGVISAWINPFVILADLGQLIKALFMRKPQPSN